MKQLNFGKIKTKLPLPNLLDMQKQSFEDFLQLDVAPEKRDLEVCKPLLRTFSR